MKTSVFRMPLGFITAVALQKCPSAKDCRENFMNSQNEFDDVNDGTAISSGYGSVLYCKLNIIFNFCFLSLQDFYLVCYKTKNYIVAQENS